MTKENAEEFAGWVRENKAVLRRLETLGKPVIDGELLAQAARVDGISDIEGVSMWDGSNNSITTLSITNIQLPRLDKVSANVGAATDLTQTAPSTSSSLTLVPVPVIPASC